MNRVVINLDALRHNMRQVATLLERHGARWSVVTKALSGHRDTLGALHAMGVRSFADTRVASCQTLGELAPGAERWYIRPPHLSVVPEVVAHSEVSLNSELVTLRALDAEAARQGTRHRVVLMNELGDLREGITPSQLVEVFTAARGLANLDIVGVGSQMGCLSGALPTAEQVAQMNLLREYLQLQFAHKLPLLSGGSTVFLPLLRDGKLPPGVDHYRIGEALYLGTDLVDGGLMPGYRDDVITLEAEIAEIKEKSLVPLGDTSAHTPFAKLEGQVGAAEQRRGYRALLALGQLDTEVGGLEPIEPGFQVAGASSDILVVNVGADHQGLDVGDHIRFRTSYSAFVRLMSARFVDAVVEPPLEAFVAALGSEDMVPLPPSLPALS